MPEIKLNAFLHELNNIQNVHFRHADAIRWHDDPDRILFDELEEKPVGVNVKHNFFNPNSLGMYLGNFTEGTFGVELEIEGSNLPDHIRGDNRWLNIGKDNSLRGEAYEYILANPLKLKECKNAIESFNDYFTEHKAIPSFSFRTSVHVHVNVLDMTKTEIISFLYLSHLVENALVRYSGSSRIGNRFCLRTCDAEEKIKILKAFIRNKGFTSRFNSQQLKYSAINIAPLFEKGSIEFRSMRGTLSTEVLFPWLDVLENIKKLAIKHSIDEVHKNPLKFAKKVFGKYFNLFDYPEFESDLEDAYYMLIELPYITRG